MSSVPDDHQPYHEGAPPPAAVPAPTQAAAALALVKRFSPDGWQIENPNGQFWLATRQRGSEQRVIAAETVLALYGKLQRIASQEAAQPRGTYPDVAAAYLAYRDLLGCVRAGQ